MLGADLRYFLPQQAGSKSPRVVRGHGLWGQLELCLALFSLLFWSRADRQ